ncbi:MAG: phosphatidate cytidylyltransferase [Bacteroidetes bacterium]|jgi:phosphatidate cytidylyltransferase|nr:phosphatidate cytidylyltransferase [Bacteroidota bacterium]
MNLTTNPDPAILNELTKRILFAAPAAALFLWVAWLGGAYFNALMGVLALVTVWEMDRLLSSAGYPGYMIISIPFAGLLWFSPSLSEPIRIAVALAAALPFGLSYTQTGASFVKKWTSTLLIALYAPVGFLTAVMVRGFYEGSEGFWLILGLFLMIWGNDVFAYFGGKSFGKRKLAPSISPNKTWEGFGFGILGAAAGALIAWTASSTFPVSLLDLIPAALIASVTGPLGDLTASRLKRLAGMKDSSTLLPGHGGLLDRFDAMIVTAPFLYFYFAYIL